MKVYMVWIKSTNDGRWLDSQWAKEEHATKRSKELEESMRASGAAGRHDVIVVEGLVADVALQGEES